MKGLHMVAFILLIVGGLHLLLVGLGIFDLAELLGITLSRILYILIGLSALFELVTHKAACKSCSVGGGSDNAGMEPRMDV